MPAFLLLACPPCPAQASKPHCPHPRSKQFGFEQWDSPMLESEELFVRKAGEEITEQLYNFEVHQGGWGLWPHACWRVGLDPAATWHGNMLAICTQRLTGCNCYVCAGQGRQAGGSAARADPVPCPHGAG